MAEATTYLSLTRDDLRAVVQEMIQHDAYISTKKAWAVFEFSETFLRTLVSEGRITAYPVIGHAKMVRYKYSELEAVFLNQQNQSVK